MALGCSRAGALTGQTASPSSPAHECTGEAVCCDESGVPVFEMLRHSRILLPTEPQLHQGLALPGALRRRSELFNFRSCRRVCRQLKSRHAEARKTRSPRCLHRTTPRARYASTESRPGALGRAELRSPRYSGSGWLARLPSADTAAAVSVNAACHRGQIADAGLSLERVRGRRDMPGE